MCCVEATARLHACKIWAGISWIRSHDMQKGPSAAAHRSKLPCRTTYLRIGDKLM